MRLTPPGRMLHLLISPPISTLPSYGLLSVVTMALVLFFIQPFFPEVSTGLWVSAVRKDSVTTQSNLSASGLVLRIDSKNRWYLNSELVPREEMPAALIRELSRHPDWVVFLEADRNLDYKDVVPAMDTIRSVNAKIVLLTRPQQTDTQ